MPNTTAVILSLPELVEDIDEPWPNIFGAALADRIELLHSDPGNREPEIRAQTNRLRELAQRYEN